nr:MAG TPA: hypothetical protein [Caudoviricetes sp.]
MRGYPLTYPGFRVINTIRQRTLAKKPERTKKGAA